VSFFAFMRDGTAKSAQRPRRRHVTWTSFMIRRSRVWLVLLAALLGVVGIGWLLFVGSRPVSTSDSAAGLRPRAARVDVQSISPTEIPVVAVAPLLHCADLVDVVLLASPHHAHTFDEVHAALAFATGVLQGRPLVVSLFPPDSSRPLTSVTSAVRQRIHVFTSFCLITPDQAVGLPAHTIMWQLEPLVRRTSPTRTEANRYLCQHNTSLLDRLSNHGILWEYSRINMDWWQRERHLGSTTTLSHVPLFWYPGIISNNGPHAESASDSDPPSPSTAPPLQDIDVVLVGTLSFRRRRILHALRALGVQVVDKASFGVARERLLRRAKIVLNIHHDQSDLLETVRLQLLLSLQCFVVSEATSDGAATREFQPLLQFASYSQLVETVMRWLKRPSVDRAAVAARGYAYITSASMVQVFRPLLEAAARQWTGHYCSYAPRIFNRTSTHEPT
jgi:hypothetical protein